MWLKIQIIKSKFLNGLKNGLKNFENEVKKRLRCFGNPPVHGYLLRSFQRGTPIRFFEKSPVTLISISSRSCVPGRPSLQVPPMLRCHIAIKLPSQYTSCVVGVYHPPRSQHCAVPVAGSRWKHRQTLSMIRIAWINECVSNDAPYGLHPTRNFFTKFTCSDATIGEIRRIQLSTNIFLTELQHLWFDQSKRADWLTRLVGGTPSIVTVHYSCGELMGHFFQNERLIDEKG